MSKIEQIKEAIQLAIRRESKLTPLALSVPALSSVNIRHLMNNLGAISMCYLEIGVHKGGLFCSTICNNPNLKMVASVDNWASDEGADQKVQPEFYENASIFLPENTIHLATKSNSFDVKIERFWTNIPFDLYCYDADHSEESQRQALTHYINLLTDEFIFCVDDFDWPQVESGTMAAILDLGLNVNFFQIFKGNDHDNDGWYNGFAVFLLKKQ